MEFMSYADDLLEYTSAVEDMISSVMKLDFSMMKSAIQHFREVAVKIENTVQEYKKHPKPHESTNEQLEQLNEQLMYTERGFLVQFGLPRRPW